MWICAEKKNTSFSFQRRFMCKWASAYEFAVGQIYWSNIPRLHKNDIDLWYQNSDRCSTMQCISMWFNWSFFFFPPYSHFMVQRMWLLFHQVAIECWTMRRTWYQRTDPAGLMMMIDDLMMTKSQHNLSTQLVFSLLRLIPQIQVTFCIMMHLGFYSGIQDGQVQAVSSNVPTFYAVLWKFVNHLICMLSQSKNGVITALVVPAQNDTKCSSYLWKHWNRCLCVFLTNLFSCISVFFSFFLYSFFLNVDLSQ